MEKHLQQELLRNKMFKAKKGLTEGLSVFLIILMLIILAAASFSWITKINEHSKTSTENFAENLNTRIGSDVEIVTENLNENILSVFVENRGLNKIKLNNSIGLILYVDKELICARDAYHLNCLNCNGNISPGELKRIDILLNKECDISKYSGTVRYSLDFEGVVGVASQFRK